jgi:prepilin-type N-terminal cleavage/methylation domain-containing protein
MRGADKTRRPGFTLVELMVALAITAILALATTAPFLTTIRSRDRAELAMQRVNAVRLTLARLDEELEGAIILPPTNPPAPERYRFSVVDRTLDLPSSELRFATTTARRVSAGAQDPVEIVSYRLEAGLPGQRGARLVKGQQASLAPTDLPPLEFVILEQVTTFRVRVLPRIGATLADNWLSPDSGGLAALPQAVTIDLSLDDGSENPFVYHLTVPLPLARPARRT